MSNIVIPNVKIPSDNTGLFLREGIYYIRYLKDGRKTPVSTGKTSVIAARACRDAFYKKLLKEGATVATRKKLDNGRRAARAKEDPDAYIRQREPFVVVIENTVVAECPTRKAARAARDQYLGVK